jgi:zinc/manganese transport system substrate-binding protein
MRVVLGILAISALAACGGDGGGGGGGATRVVVTTALLGDVVRNVVGDAPGVEVEVVMPPGADPHELAPSARQAEAMAEADLLVVSGAGFESGLQSAIDASDATTFVAADHVELLDGDPHWWNDPTRMIPVVEALDELLPGTTTYADELRALDAELEELAAGLPRERRVLVTNHESLRYLAERYGFEVVGAVIPSLSTGAEASASDLEALAEVIRVEQVPAIFAETSSSTAVAEALADEVGEVEVVELFAESLGDEGSGAATYLDMQRTNMTRIVEASRP